MLPQSGFEALIDGSVVDLWHVDWFFVSFTRRSENFGNGRGAGGRGRFRRHGTAARGDNDGKNN